jgi:hypothetical protein
MSDYKKVLEFLKENKVDPEKALVTLKRNFGKKPDNKTNLKFHWKMMRFTLYLWERIKEEDQNIVGKRIDTVRKVVWSSQYKRLYATFPLPTFNPENEVKKLAQLIAEPRQAEYFTSKNFVYPKGHLKANKPIPQSIIDKIR